jgi:nicotinamidase-related amidase
MTNPKTLLQLAGVDLTPARLNEASLVLIDFQNEYLVGPVALPAAEPAIAEAGRLVAAARETGAPIFHIAHRGRGGSLFDPDAERGQIVAPLRPQAGEVVVEKGLPNAFAGTELQERLAQTGRKRLIIAGFMTHMCVSSTARAALDFGYSTTVVASACATRDLPDGRGGIIPAATIHDVALVELSDRFAVIAQHVADVL